MKFLVFSDYQKLSEAAAEQFSKQLRQKPDSLLGLATGSSPEGMYRELAKRKVDFSRAETVNLDEYVSLPATHSQSYAYFMRDKLFDLVNIDQKRTHIPCGTAKDLKEECLRYDELLKKLGHIDLQILGIGHNGHIGFNEPQDHFEKNTHVVDLKQSTIEANARFFSSLGEVPRQAITMGLYPIMTAKKIFLLASGEGKAKILKEAFFGPITPFVPASILQLHPDVTLFADEEAFRLCKI